MTQIYPLIHITTIITALKTVTLLLGAMIAYFAYKAYRRTGARPLGLLAVGFAIVTLGSLLAGVFDVGLTVIASGLDPDTARQYAIVSESLLTAVGFGVIVYSLYAR